MSRKKKVGRKATNRRNQRVLKALSRELLDTVENRGFVGAGDLSYALLAAARVTEPKGSAILVIARGGGNKIGIARMIAKIYLAM